MFLLKDTIPGRSPRLMLWTLSAINAGVVFFELLLSEAQVEKFFYLLGLVPALRLQGSDRTVRAPRQRRPSSSTKLATVRKVSSKS